MSGLRADRDAIDVRLPFAQARDNFYTAARHGLDARLVWPTERGMEEFSVRALIIDTLLPLARRGLASLDIPEPEIGEYLGIIAERVDSGRNGATWQRRWVARNGPDPHALVCAYAGQQQRDLPVHTWAL